VAADRAGFVHAIDCEKLGNACVVLGGGRSCKDDVVNPAVGLRIRARLGDRLALGQPMVDILHDDGIGLEHADRLVREAYVVSNSPTQYGSRILEVLS
jgi:pyrimidine-nucleoside phosphorylase